ncbi:MAG TPA: chromosome replication initiation protein, partial [Bacillota bacterium]|nr:chromosome replication initiation protein [Bacillota bacterium]
MNGIGKILPVEGYIAKLTGDMPVTYTTSLSHLYQPLIGPYAITLYHTLLTEVEFQQGNPQTHHTLMNYTNLALDDIYHTRLRLEGIGLLNTYETEMKHHRVYIYELQCPFPPKEFFQDDMLSQLLYHHIGEKAYKKLEKYFCGSEDHATLKQVTASFYDVFNTQQSTFSSVPVHERKKENTGLKVEKTDFTWMEQSLRAQMIPVHHVLTGT